MAKNKVLAVVGATGIQGGGLARAILDDESGQFALRAITRNPGSKAAVALAERGAEVVEADSLNMHHYAYMHKHATSQHPPCTRARWPREV
mgnify:CR=1 FL=1